MLDLPGRGLPAGLAAGLAAPYAARVVRSLPPPGRRPRLRGCSALASRRCSPSSLPPRPAAPPGRESSSALPSTSDAEPLRRLAAAAAAVLVTAGALFLPAPPAPATPLHPTPHHPSLHATTASLAEDALLSALRTAQAAGDATVGGLLNLLPGRGSGGGGLTSTPTSTPPSPAAAAAAAAQATALALLQEVHEVVSANYVDVRGRGFDREHWEGAYAAAVNPPPRDLPSARRAVRALLAFGLKGDPYTRYAPPSEFAGMARYDLTGVGLNLGTGDEFERKTGERPPGLAAVVPPALPGDPPPGGVWVVGLVGGSPAAAAGVLQGDRLLSVGGSGVGGTEAPGAVAARVRAAAAAAAAAPAPSSPAAASSSSPSPPPPPPTFPLEVAHPDGSRATLAISPPPAPPASAAADTSPVSVRTERGGALGVVRLSAFTATARADTVAALSALAADRRVSELALDLRGNRGGSCRRAWRWRPCSCRRARS